MVIGQQGEVAVEVERGCPQGSIVGPLPCNLIMNPLLHQISNRCGFSTFADDLFFSVKGNREYILRGKCHG